MEMQVSKFHKITGRRTLLFGLLALVFGLIIIVNGFSFTQLGFDFISLYLTVVGLVNIVLQVFTRKKEGTVWPSLLQITFAMGISWLNRISDVPVNIVIISLGSYQLLTAGIYGVTYLLYRQNHVKGGLRYLFIVSETL